MFQLWMLWKYMFKGAQWRSPTTLLSLLGMALGVACLFVAMAVVSGFQSTLEKAVVDVVGHLTVMKTGVFSAEEIEMDIDPLVSGKVLSTPFLSLKAVYADKGKVKGVVMEGADASKGSVTQFSKLLIAGSADLSSPDETPSLLVGKELFESSGLKLGDIVRLVIPISGGVDASDFRSKLGRFRITGVLHFGHYEFDSRYLITDLKSAQAFGEVGDRVTGVRYKLETTEQALASQLNIFNKLGYNYRVDTWKDYNANLFEAAALEKLVIFFVLLIIVIAACFNISATLFISVVRRFHDISVLKTLGATSRQIRRFFTIQGLCMGAMGSLLGLGLGFLLCLAFEMMQRKWGIILGQVYKVDHIDLEIRWIDAGIVVLASMFICYLATLAPALKGSRLPPVEGLRYD